MILSVKHEKFDGNSVFVGIILTKDTNLGKSVKVPFSPKLHNFSTFGGKFGMFSKRCQNYDCKFVNLFMYGSFDNLL